MKELTFKEKCAQMGIGIYFCREHEKDISTLVKASLAAREPKSKHNETLTVKFV